MANLNLEETEQRTCQDRRKKATPLFSRYTFFGQRKDFRRQADQEKGGYVDVYSSKLFFFLVLIIGLNVLDAFLTLMILDVKGWWEANPIVRCAMDLYGDNFWIWKFAVVSLCSVLLCVHSKFRRTRGVVVSLSLFYLAIIIYQIFLIRYQ